MRAHNPTANTVASAGDHASCPANLAADESVATIGQQSPASKSAPHSSQPEQNILRLSG
jgi:hypothetical protein